MQFVGHYVLTVLQVFRPVDSLNRTSAQLRYLSKCRSSRPVQYSTIYPGKHLGASKARNGKEKRRSSLSNFTSAGTHWRESRMMQVVHGTGRRISRLVLRYYQTGITDHGFYHIHAMPCACTCTYNSTKAYAGLPHEDLDGKPLDRNVYDHVPTYLSMPCLRHPFPEASLPFQSTMEIIHACQTSSQPETTTTATMINQGKIRSSIRCS